MMQLLFTLEELQILAEVLETATERDEDPARVSMYEDLLDRALSRRLQFSADELDAIMELVRDADARSRRAVVNRKLAFEHRREILQRIADKLTEAAAMA